MTKFLSLVIVFLICSFISVTADQDCISIVKEIFKKVNGEEAVTGDRVYFMDYNVKTISRSNANPGADLNIKLYINKDYTQIVSTAIEVYKDPKNTYMVVPGRKTIYWGTTSTNDTTLTTGNLNFLREKFLERSTLKNCKDVVNEKYTKEVIITPGEAVKQNFGLTEMKFLLDSEKKTLYKVFMNYAEDMRLSSVEITYNTIDYNYTKTKINQPSKQKIFKTDGTLLPRFAGYKVMDVRKK